jgi:hypothetical protein
VVNISAVWPLAALLLGGCASVPLEQTGALSSYQNLVPSDGVLTHARVGVNKVKVTAARTIRIFPTSFSDAASGAGLSKMQRDMVGNAIDRSLCIGLSDRFHVVAYPAPADLSVHAVITHVGLTDEVIAGASRVVTTGGSIAEKLLLPLPVPVPIPRIPLGLGGLSVEAEAVDGDGHQAAAMIWARGADAVTTKPKVSTAGDAYDLAKFFAGDLSRLLVTGENPFRTLPTLPSISAVASMLGAAPKEPECERFGRGPGVIGLISDNIGLPPEWTDKGAPTSTQEAKDVSTH